jgi:hypothetical protein
MILFINNGWLLLIKAVYFNYWIAMLKMYIKIILWDSKFKSPRGPLMFNPALPVAIASSLSGRMRQHYEVSNVDAPSPLATFIFSPAILRPRTSIRHIYMFVRCLINVLKRINMFDKC